MRKWQVIPSGKGLCLWVKLCLPESYVEVPNPPVPVNVTLFGNNVFTDEIKLRWSHSGFSDQCSYKKRRFRHKDRQTCLGRRSHEGKDRDWSDSSTNQVTPTIPGKYQKLEETRKDPSLAPSERAWPCWYLDDTLISHIWPPDLSLLLLWATQFMVISYSSYRKLFRVTETLKLHESQRNLGIQE